MKEGNKSKKVVISLSRRTEPYFFARELTRLLLTRYPPERVHTVVVWTKFPQVVLNTMRDVLKKYDQVYVHLTITGLGGTPVEPRVPRPEEALSHLPELIDFLGDPRRLRVRPDPLAVIRRGPEVFSNIEKAAEIIRRAVQLGVRHFSTSFMEVYPKVRRRLTYLGFEAVELDQKERKEIWETLANAAAEGGGTLYACCVPGWPTSRCIDGALLKALHPRGEDCRTDKPVGQRTLCGCTHSVDLGWYSMKCPAGCLYCYAEPLRS
ncbi:MAG: DUF1848 domain-containing protein [Thermanaeromonas sp.]|uniref:DUF1848 family protein n=1 Tax=Thermanaeromonas sp. TaxID=2003697 RepID=UPI00243F3E4C|nr:DUF1848 family protein [Thermanaeromonas sp.]MCG0277049.1 DUF1848 domain-containing protein [Thermanaeromonas sp.]